MKVSSTTSGSGSTRLASIDAYRGWVMLLMMAEVLHLGKMARAFPDSGFWTFLGHHQSHIEWVGCTLHDLIQPSFSFLVGTALAFSVANRQARGQTGGRMLAHAIWRAILLIWLGIFLRSVDAGQTNFTFEDTLTQIGLGYVPLYLLAFRARREQWAACVTVLVGFWLAFLLWPLPGSGFDYGKVGVSAKWMEENGLSGMAAHWQKNSNLAWAFDGWFLNLFPRATAWAYNGGGYATLSFIPTWATMVLGLLAGGMLRAEGEPELRWKRLIRMGLILLALGWALGWLGICPVVKRIWTPSWVLFSGGWCFLFLAVFHLAIDVKGWRGPVFPLLVIGMNSIAAYCIAHLWETFVVSSFRTHLGSGVFEVLGTAYVPVVQGVFVLASFWLILLWLYRQKIFIRI